MSTVGRFLYRGAFLWAVVVGDVILTLFGRPTPLRPDADVHVRDDA